MVDAYGSPAVWLPNSLARKTARDDQLIREAVLAKIAKVQRDLEGPDPAPIVKLLVERAAICRFAVHSFEQSYENAGGTNLNEAEYHQRPIDRAHRRFLSVLETLARVRKPAPPALQVNIAKNQVNVT